MVLTFLVAQNGALSVSNKIFYTYINKEDDFFNVLGESLDNINPTQDSVIGNWTDAVNFMLKVVFAVIDMKAVPVIIFRVANDVKFAYNNNGKMTLIIPENGDKIYTTFAEAYIEESAQVEAFAKHRNDLLSKKTTFENDITSFKNACNNLHNEADAIYEAIDTLNEYIKSCEQKIENLQHQIALSKEKISNNDNELNFITSKIKLFNDAINDTKSKITEIDNELMK